MSRFTNAKFGNVGSSKSQLTFYIIITGHDHSSVAYQWFDKWPISGWFTGIIYERVTYLEYDGVRFGFFDYQPLKANKFYQAIMCKVLRAEDVHGR